MTDAQMSALAEQLGTLAWKRTRCPRRSSAPGTGDGAERRRRASDRAALVELTARLRAANQDAGLVEPIPQ